MPDDQAPPAELPAEAPAQAGTSQTPVSDGLSEPIAPAPSEPIPESTPEASASAPSEPAQPVSEAAPEAVAAEPRSEVEPPESEPAPRTQGTASEPSPAPTKSPEHDRELLKIARAKIQTKKQQNFEKILKLFDTKEKITNDDVEKALRCSDRSAARYLEELVKQGKIKRVGETGAGVVYIKA